MSDHLFEVGHNHLYDNNLSPSHIEHHVQADSYLGALVKSEARAERAEKELEEARQANEYQGWELCAAEADRDAYKKALEEIQARLNAVVTVVWLYQEMLDPEDVTEEDRWVREVCCDAFSNSTATTEEP